MNDQIQASIIAVVSVVVANWVTLFPLIKSGVKTAWDKSIEWRDMVNDISNLKKRVDKLDRDVTAAHDKLRNFHRPG